MGATDNARQDKSSSALGAEVCGLKPHHLKTTAAAAAVTLCTKPTSLSFYLILCKSACDDVLFSRETFSTAIQQEEYMQSPCNGIGNDCPGAAQKMHPHCIVRGTVASSAVVFGEMTNSRGGGLSMGKARERSIFGDRADSGMLGSSNHS